MNDSLSRKTEFFDAHTHAHFPIFEKDSAEVITRAFRAGVGMVNVGTKKETSALAVKFAHQYESDPVFAAVGLHPVHAGGASFHDTDETQFTPLVENEFDLEYYRELAKDSKVVAIGECGLDFARVESEKLKVIKEKQKEVFLAQIRLAQEVQKPLMIHCRNAFPDLISILKSYFVNHKSPEGIIHFFTGTKEEAQALLDLGFSFTFGGVITFARNYDEVIKILPMNRILSETDAPYVAPVPYRGKRNEPFYVIEVVKKLAEIKSLPLEETKKIILENAGRIFQI